MVRSLYAGVSGLTTHQTRMDVIGNNIANVNTYGFKASRVTFRDIYYQTAIGATGGRQTFAGNNPAQVGYGVQLGSIDKDMSMSNFQSTNYVWDLAIAGDGFFMTSSFDGLNVNSDKTAATVKYTRMGAFTVDNYGNLVTTNNTFVVGSRNSLNGLRATYDESLAAMNDIQVVDRNGDGNINASDITFRNVINLTELMQQAFNVYTDDYGYMYGYDWNEILSENGPEVDADDPTKVTAMDGLIVFDVAAFGGTPEELAAIEDPEELMKYIDIQQTIMNFNDQVSNDGDSKDDVLALRQFVDKTGKFIELEDSDYATLYADLEDAETQEELTEARSAVTSAGGIVGELTYGDAEAVNVGIDGIITITYNSQMKSVARIELGVFDNPNGLAEDGTTTFAETVASGSVKIKRAGLDPGVTETKIKSNFLEMSNVNLAQEFSDMIVTQRGFQANARIITTSDSMLEELVNLKR